jgi:single-strand DNA-binding protein
MNKVILSGRLTKDPEISSSASGTKFARFSIAVPRKYKKEGEPDADFFNCSTFGKTSDFVEKYFKKGNKIEVSGRLENNSYTNRDGKKVNETRVMVEEADFGESKGSSQTQQSTDSFLSVPDGLVEELPFS